MERFIGDMICNAIFFFVIWKFFWKKSRFNHMLEQGYSGTADRKAFFFFIFGVSAITLTPAFTGVITFETPFVVIGGVVGMWLLTTRYHFGAFALGEGFDESGNRPSVIRGFFGGK